MKQTYIKPATEQIEAEVIEMVCASKYTLNRYGQWGASAEQSDYGNNKWVIENYQGSAEKIGGFTAVDIEDDTDDLASRSNEGLWE
jgi:hypothetical protein